MVPKNSCPIVVAAARSRMRHTPLEPRMPDLDGGSPSTIRLSMKITIALDLSAGEGRRLARRKAADAIATDYDYLDNNDYDNDHPDNVGVGLQHPDNAADS